MQEKQVGCSQSAVLWISDGIGEICRFPHRSILEKSCRQHADAIDDENLEFMRMFAYTGDSISDRGHPFAAQCLSVLRGCDGKEVNGMAMDEELYRQYLCGDEAGLVALMKNTAIR